MVMSPRMKISPLFAATVRRSPQRRSPELSIGGGVRDLELLAAFDEDHGVNALEERTSTVARPTHFDETVIVAEESMT